MRFLLALIIHATVQSVCVGCSVYCKIPTIIDNNYFIGEGLVVGYTGDYTREDIVGEFGLLKIAVIKLQHPTLKVDTIFLSEFGLGASCQTLGTSVAQLKKTYTLNSTITFIGHKSTIFKDSIIHISIEVCDYVYAYGMGNRARYDYQNKRTAPSLDKIVWDQLDNISEKNKWLWGYDIENVHRLVKHILQGLIVPEEYQVYLDILELNRAKSKEVKYYILQRLIWSNYIDINFIKEQAISKKQKAELLKEYDFISTNWPQRY